MNELLEELEIMLKNTLNIQKVFDKLCSLEMIKDLSLNYDDIKTKLLVILKRLLDNENAALDFLKDAEDIDDVLEVLYDEEDKCLSSISTPCLKRIRNYLSKLLLKRDIFLVDDEMLDEYLTNEFLTYVTIDRKFTRDEMLIFILQVLPNLNDSLIKHFMISIEEEIAKEKDYQQKRKLIKLKYNTLLAQGKGFEFEVLNNQLHGNIANELSMPNVQIHLKEDLINFEIMNNLYNIIVVLSSIEEEDLALEELIWFKTYLIYLNDNMLKLIRDYLTNRHFQNESIKNKLFTYLDDLNNTKKLHNQDYHNYQK